MIAAAKNITNRQDIQRVRPVSRLGRPSCQTASARRAAPISAPVRVKIHSKSRCASGDGVEASAIARDLASGHSDRLIGQAVFCGAGITGWRRRQEQGAILHPVAFGRITLAMNFSSDTAAPAHPAILAALSQANSGGEASYGADKWMMLAKQRLIEVFETDLDIWLVSSGTAANALALAAMCPSTHAILCHEEAHIERDERGAPEFFTGGAKLSLLHGANAKIDSGELKRRLDLNQPDFVHETPLRVLSLSNLTECGAAYSPAELAECATLAKAAGLMVHLDGARFANALVSSGATPAAMSWRSGVDVMSFGATKNGALGCEAILLFGEARKFSSDLQIRAKRAGHMPPKMRFLGAQMAAYLEGGLWLELARRANVSALKLAEIFTNRAGGRLMRPVDGNEVFVTLSQAAVDRLRQAGASFYPWADGSLRFVCSWATSAAEIEDVARHLG